MKQLTWIVSIAAAAWAASAEPSRVAVLEFEDLTGAQADPALGGMVDARALASKGVFVVAQALVNQPGYAVIDRRDFLAQIERGANPGDPKPSFLRAAQALNADFVLRGALQAFSTGKTRVDQGGHSAEFSTLTLRIGLEALDPVDGTIIAAATGAAETKVRQTDSLKTTFSEADILALLEQAVGAATPIIDQALTRRTEQARARPTARLAISTTADPALVELDGLLVGTTPIEGLEVYKGGHTLTIGRAGYRDIRARIVIDRDMKIEAPMIRTELSADEIKDVLDKARVNAIIGSPGLTILPLQ